MVLIQVLRSSLLLANTFTISGLLVPAEIRNRPGGRHRHGFVRDTHCWISWQYTQSRDLGGIHIYLVHICCRCERISGYTHYRFTKKIKNAFL